MLRKWWRARLCARGKHKAREKYPLPIYECERCKSWRWYHETEWRAAP